MLFRSTNQTPAILSSDWVVEGEVSKVIVESGQILDVNSNFIGSIEGRATSTVNLNSAASPEFVNMDINSTVNFGSQNNNIPMASYGNISLLGSSSTKLFGDGETEIKGTFVSNTGVALKGAPDNGSVLKIGGSTIINGLGFTSIDNRVTLNFNGNTTQTLSTDDDLLFYKLKVENNTDVVVNGPPALIATLGSLNGGGLEILNGSSQIGRASCRERV